MRHDFRIVLRMFPVFRLHALRIFQIFRMHMSRRYHIFCILGLRIFPVFRLHLLRISPVFHPLWFRLFPVFRILNPEDSHGRGGMGAGVTRDLQWRHRSAPSYELIKPQSHLCNYTASRCFPRQLRPRLLLTYPQGTSKWWIDSILSNEELSWRAGLSNILSTIDLHRVLWLGRSSPATTCWLPNQSLKGLRPPEPPAD